MLRTLDTGHVTCFPKRVICSEDIDYDKFVGIVFLVMSEEQARDMMYQVFQFTPWDPVGKLFHAKRVDAVDFVVAFTPSALPHVPFMAHSIVESFYASQVQPEVFPDPVHVYGLKEGMSVNHITDFAICNTAEEKYAFKIRTSSPIFSPSTD